jgi:hypothetical protein
MSYASSAGIARGAPGYGTTCRQDVLGGVEIPVMSGAAGRACPVPGAQLQLREQVPARRAGVVRGLAGAAGLEPRVAGAPGEERGEPAATTRRTPRSGMPGRGPSSWRSAPGRPARRRCPCRRRRSEPGGRPGYGSTPPGRSRTCAPAPAAAPDRDMPGTDTPFSPLQGRTYDRKIAGATPYEWPSFPAPLRGAPHSSLA